MTQSDRASEDLEYRTEPQVICFQNSIILGFLILIIGLLSITINPNLAVAIATLVLAMVTSITVFQNRKQSEQIQRQTENMQKQSEHLRAQAERMRENIEFKRQPRLSIYEHEEDDSLVVFQNTSSVPFEATIRLSLTPYEVNQSTKNLLKPDVNYQSLPDEVKVSSFEEDWTGRHFFLQEYGAPVDRKEVDIRGLLKYELRSREVDYSDGQVFWFRVDAELTQTLYDEDRYESYLFKIAFLEEKHDVFIGSKIFSPYSFRQARKDMEKE